MSVHCRRRDEGLYASSNQRRLIPFSSGIVGVVVRDMTMRQSLSEHAVESVNDELWSTAQRNAVKM